MTLDKDYTPRSSDVGASAGSVTPGSGQQPNGTSPGPRSPGGKPMVNGDYFRTPADEPGFLASAGNAYGMRLSSSQPEDTSHLPPDADRLSPSQNGPHRYSSPPVPSGVDAPSQQDPNNAGLRHRHTLQVPRTTSGRRSSRDHSEDAAYSSGRLSPTAGARRPSFNLGRRASRTNRSDTIPDEMNPDDDAARWAEAFKQRRASRRKRRDDDDDERVIVGTKVDQNHVNWVTAYNMLTGIRFTVSRINAKMDRELTPADFDAKHKFSFDMYVSNPPPPP